MKTTLLASILLLSGTVSLGSQGRSVSIESTTDGMEACSLLTRAEVEAAVGTSVAQPAPDTGRLGEVPFSHCTYNLKNDPELVAVLLTVYTYKSEPEVRAFVENARKEVGAETIPVMGIGDVAYWWKDKATLFVSEDEHIVSVFLGPGVDESLKAAQNIAQKVLNRIREGEVAAN